MSTKSFEWNRSTTYYILCTVKLSGRKLTFTHITTGRSDKEAFESATKAVVWSRHPTFKMQIVKKITY